MQAPEKDSQNKLPDFCSASRACCWCGVFPTSDIGQYVAYNVCASTRGHYTPESRSCMRLWAHPCLIAERELKYRRWMHYPPFGVLANVLVQSPKLEEAVGWSAMLGKWFQAVAPEGVRVLGPCTAPIARIKNAYRFHLILKAGSRKALNAALRGMLAQADAAQIPRRNLIVDVDALRLM